MRTLANLALLGLLAACGAPGDESGKSSAGAPNNDSNTFRADSGPAGSGRPDAGRGNSSERSYAGEWAATADQCGNQQKIWTIEAFRLGAKKERFCAFEKIFISAAPSAGETWSASAKCLSGGKESNDFLFFRVAPSRSEMRLTINDAEAIDLVRCPSRT